jgi:release factor glutamine methyltransferase
MTTSLPAGTYPRVVARLRSAGCVFAEDEARLLVAAAHTPADLAALVDQRAAGAPLEQVLGWAQFWGLRILLDPGVFVPRRRTEHLVRQAVAAVGSAGRTRPVVLDLCCGSGALSAALLSTLPGAEAHAADLDPKAVACARRNLGDAAHLYVGDLYAPLPTSLRGRVDVLVANVPYVPTSEIRLLPAEAREHEPHAALDGGVDGLDVARRVVAGAPDWLAAGASVLIETTEEQAPVLAAAAAAVGLQPTVVTDSDLGATVVVATRAQHLPASGAISPEWRDISRH